LEDTTSGGFASPAMDKNGKIYIGHEKLYIIDPTDPENYKTVDFEVGTIKAIAIDVNKNILYAGTSNGYLVAYDISTGEYSTYNNYLSITSKLAIDSEGNVYFGDKSGYFNMFDPINKKLSYIEKLDNQIKSGISVDLNDNVYFGDDGKKFYVYNPTDNSITTYSGAADYIRSGIAINNNILYFGDDDAYLYSFNTNTKEVKQFFRGNDDYGKIDSSPVIDPDGNIYYASSDGYLYAINSDGVFKWRANTGMYESISSPLIDDKGNIYIGNKAIFDVYDSDGNKIWTYSSQNEVDTAPLLYNDNLYLVDRYGWLECVYSGNNLADSSWPMFQHDSQHTGMAQTNNTYPSKPNLTSPEDGDTNIATSDLILKWNASSDSDEGDTVTYDLYFSKDSSPKLYKSDLSSTQYTIESLDADTTYYWKVVAKDTKGGIASSNIWSFTTKQNSDNSIGKKKWSYPTGNSVNSSSAIGSDGTIYIGSNDNYLYAINPDGSLEWKYETGGGLESSSPAIGSDGTIYFGSGDNCFYAVNPNGTLKWKYETGNWIVGSPAIGSGGTIYFGSGDNYLYAVNPNGTLKWKYETGDHLRSSPTIGNNGTIYIGSGDFNFYAMSSDSNGLIDSPWPIFHHDIRHTGKQ
jgi:outer membrane protein assembly factor BamB